MSDSRVNLGAAAPELSQTVLQLEKQVWGFATGTNLAPGFLHLLKLRASQLNGCSYCVRMHARDALKDGESPDRVALVAAWRESDYFDGRERAALALVESITLIADGNVPDAVYQEAAQALTEQEVAAVGWMAVMINIWNRLAVTSRQTVAP